MSLKAQIVDGPHAGRSYAMTYPPRKIYLPIWPEPDVEGPPYAYAVYEQEAETDPPLKYKYLETQTP